MQYVIPNSFVWNENKFTAMVSVNNQKLAVSGNLIVDSKLNHVVGLNYKWDDAADFSYKIEYSYTDIKDDAQFPSKILVYGYGAIGNNPLMVFNINEYSRNPKIIVSNLDPNVLFPKAQKVQFTKSGLKAAFIPSQIKNGDPETSSKARLFILLTFILTSSFFAWLIVRSRLAKPTKKTNKHKHETKNI